jgi:hypothetical protein
MLGALTVWKRNMYILMSLKGAGNIATVINNGMSIENWRITSYKGKNMNWLIKKLANESTYFPIFLAALSIYAMVGCLVVRLTIDAHPGAIARIIFVFMFGATLVAYGGRVVHNLCYAKVLKDEQK